MRLLINFAPLKKGGGQNVGLNFINGLNIQKYPDIEFFFAVAEGSIIEAKLRDQGYKNILSLPVSATKRMLKEITEENRYIKLYCIDAVYSYFGYALITKNICQICGVADSNLLYPEIDFWEGYHGLGRLKKWVIDQYRKYGYRRANGLVFENEAMEARAKEIFGDKCNSIFIKPSFSITKNIEYRSVDIDTSETLKGLFLCGWQRNKGILKIPEMIKAFQESGTDVDFYISTSIDESDPVCKEFLRTVNGYLDHVHFLGTVDKTQIEDLYSKIDLVFLLSKLESFSNNIIEAWYYRKPLIIADEEWSRSICKDAALYVDRNDAKSIVSKIVSARLEGKLEEVVNNGTREFFTYPSIENKVDQEINYVKKVFGMVKI